MIAGTHPDTTASSIAAAIGEPARACILYYLIDGHARTGTELSVVAGVAPSTASVHLDRLKAARLVQVHVQGKHRYYSLAGPRVAQVLEGLSVLAGGNRQAFVPNTPDGLCAARTCYDHAAGKLGVSLHDCFFANRWLRRCADKTDAYDLTPAGERSCAALGIDVAAARSARRRFAYSCLDWSERRPHVGGALGAAMLRLAIGRKWLRQELDSRALEITRAGRREMQSCLGLQVQ